MSQSTALGTTPTKTGRLQAYAPAVLSAVRVMTALLFIEHGLMKLVHFPAPMSGLSGPLPPLLLAAALIEIIAGGLIALDLFTRVAAFIASGEMAAAYFMAHMPHSFWPGINQGDPAILFCFVFFYFVFAGPGTWSFDAALGREGGV